MSFPRITLGISDHWTVYKRRLRRFATVSDREVDLTDAKIVVVIPARMASSRFPGKPLAKILGLEMIEHVRRRITLSAKVSGVYVATCDEEIRSVVESCGGSVIMTSDRHERCTDRIEEAARSLDCDIIVNVQGDEPTVLPEVVELVVTPLIRSSGPPTSCIVYTISNLSELENPNIVKTVLSRTGSILYFSRSPIPYRRDGAKRALYKQSGIMAFRKDFLHLYSQLEPTPLEIAESVDMLRVLEHDHRIAAVISNNETVGVDVPGDVEKTENWLLNDPIQKQLYESVLSI